MSTKSTKRKAPAKRTTERKRSGVTDLASARSKAQAKNSARGVKRHYANPTLDKALAAVMVSERIPTDLRVATKGNASARRAWATENGVAVQYAEVCRKATGRADNAVRALILAHPNPKVAATVGYVAAVDSVTLRTFPTHPLAGTVLLYRK
jgi:hypothetical protein